MFVLIAQVILLSQQRRKNTLQRHVKVELGYYIFRCSFCDEKSNDPRTLINHYASTHGIPTKWLSN